MSEQLAAPRPVDPVVDWDNAFCWEAAKRGELVSRRCEQCGYMVHPPVPMCPQCHGLAGTLKMEIEHQRRAGDSADFAEGVAAFNEKRKPAFTGR